jgi:hypothetical protein
MQPGVVSKGLISMAKSLLRKAFWCTAALTGFLFLAWVGIHFALMAYYRPSAEFAYNDILALRESRTLGILRELHTRILYLLLVGLIASILLGAAVLVLRRFWKQQPRI